MKKNEIQILVKSMDGKLLAKCLLENLKEVIIARAMPFCSDSISVGIRETELKL
jgi:hypothetical protein